MSHTPSPPSAEERNLYYFGLPSCPKLVARSSMNVWQNPQRLGPTTFTGTYNMYPKSFQPVGKHPLLHRLWNDATSSLRVQIVEAVSVADWTAVDTLRVGLNKEYNITLIIAVAPETLSWTRGHSIALRCKSILEEHGINDVHCEIQESLVTSCADSTSKPSSTFKLSSALIEENDFYAPMFVDLSDCLGTKIAMKHMPSRFGTKHVVINSEIEGIHEYRRPGSGALKEFIQIHQPAYELMLKTAVEDVGRHDKSAANYKQMGQSESAATWTALSNTAKALKKSLIPFENSSSRVFGQILYSPQYDATSDQGTNWLRDWALIELLPRNHEIPLRSIKNKVFIGDERRFLSLIERGREGLDGFDIPIRPPVKDGFVELQTTIVPMAELRNPKETTTYNDEPATIIAKYGANGNFTLGLGSTLASLTRTTETPSGDRHTMSEEWPIVSILMPEFPEKKFSLPGDSGSCIWDMQRRPAGMMTAGNGMNNQYDITYAQPLERIIADIRSRGFDVSLVRNDYSDCLLPHLSA
ncbi:uncharacterized protein TRIVIDRAFT_225726 [Trichoderma virens Gv29-8]|uniref:Uncharacterized protein n=1 Tax=Hypocrea virens (strain Gv29-8 / FGSC 10586) TaxID=413071 RepID=G9N489_HYPVG|nr:uncharacterized protein TRIVIDRAFT_225726 [Trichoderma virens Gv29-8]EHK18415.1 hypothetical protein TRIVIDRAFT_225726 [Trichoderma virens Gv29-8]UKZ52626.1 hypothetical protein TrVGV298_006407 [Trichoderma virens]